MIRSVKSCFFILVSTISIFAVLCSSCKKNDSGVKDQYIFKFGYLANEEHIWHKAAMWFAERVHEKSGGRVEIRLYPNEQLGKELEMIDSIRAGIADMTISGGSLVNWSPRIGVMECPLAIRDNEHMWKVAGGEIGREIEAEILEKIGLRSIAWFERGPRNLTSNRPIRRPDDLQGMVLRIPGGHFFLKYWEAVGAKPVPMAFSEVFTSLQQKTVEGQENPLSLIKSGGFYEVQKYVNLTEHLWTWIYVLIGEKQFQSLPPDLRQIILDAGQDMQRHHHELFVEDEKKLVQDLQEKGMIFIEVDKMAFEEKGKQAMIDAFTPEQKELFFRMVDTR
jgi:TRAP-type transport system periplasmic protein